MTQCELSTLFFGFESSTLFESLALITKFTMEKSLLAWGLEHCMSWRGFPHANTM